MDVTRLQLALALVGLLAPGLSVAQTSTANDAKVQVPELAAPQRGSLVGQLATLVFGPGDLARGAFSLPLALSAPSERGALLVNPFPAYSPDSGMSEWGMGWQVQLAIARFRVRGDLDFLTDEPVGPEYP